MLSFSVGFVLSILTLTAASPFPPQPSNGQKYEIERSVYPRQGVEPTIVFDVPPAQCVIPGRLQEWSAEDIRSTMTVFAKHYIPKLGDSGYSLFEPQLGSANAGIDRAIPPTFAFGCDSGKSMLWTPMQNNMADATDIVVMNLDNVANAVVFCGVMTKSHNPETGKYQICNPPPPPPPPQ
ncbi:MAG: hypothetical protein Q9216_001453 [Gyalolechia sp. 2 TL-2023]